MHFLQWWTHWGQNHLIVTDSEESAVRTFKFILQEESDEVRPIAMWVGERIELPEDFKAQVAINKYEEDYRQHIETICGWARTWEIHHKVYHKENPPGPLPNFTYCPNGYCEDCDYMSIHISPDYDVRGAWEEQNPAPPPYFGSPGVEPFWVVLKSFGHHDKGIVVKEVKSFKDLEWLSDLRCINLCFRGEQVELPKACTEIIRKKKAEDAHYRIDSDREYRQRQEEYALADALKAEEFFADLEERGYKRKGPGATRSSSVS
jgi:hypothetical protein